MKKSALYLVLFMSTALLLAVNAKAVNAVSKLTLSPSSSSYSTNETFKVTVGVDSGSEVAGAVDGYGTYDSTRLELVDLTESTDLVFKSGGDSGSCAITEKSGGKFRFTCYGELSAEDKAIKGNLVVMNFKAKATGTAEVKFTCADGSSSDSNIVKSSTSTDVITCASNDKGTYTITQGSSTSDDTDDTEEADTDTDTTETTTTSSELPKTGGVGSTIGLIAFGLVSVLGAVFLRFL